jgi:YHS domain-containing protein
MEKRRASFAYFSIACRNRQITTEEEHTMRTFGITLLVALFAAAVFAGPQKPAATSGLTCPVSGEAVKDLKKAPTVQYEGRTIYFCCRRCVSEFNSNPAKYASKQLVKCPVGGETVNDPGKAQTATYKGRTYYFCCQKCKAEFTKNPEKYAKQTGKTAS